MNKNISEDVMFHMDQSDASTAATTSAKIDMQLYDRAGFAVGVRSTGFTSMTVDLMEATAATAAGSSNACGRSGAVIGSAGGTAITTAHGAYEITLTLGTAATAGTTWNIGCGGQTRTVTWSGDATYVGATAISTVQTTANLYYGSTVGSTVDTGPQLSADNLKTALDSTAGGLNGMFEFATDTTATLKIKCKDAAAGPITLSGGGANVISATIQQAMVAFDARADQLSTGGNRYLGIKTSTVGVACNVNVASIRKPGRYMPSGNFKGFYST